MDTSHLTLVATPPLSVDSRKLFWRVYLDWLAAASFAETNELERVLTAHAHEVRPLVDAVSDAIGDAMTAASQAATATDLFSAVDTPAATTRSLPQSLLQALSSQGWMPSSRRASKRAA